MTRSIFFVLFVALMALLSACGGAFTAVESTQCRNFGAFPVGQICVKSDPENAPFVIRDRDQTLKAAGVANDPISGCFILQTGWYEVMLGKVQDYLGTPPETELLELKNGLRFDVMASYFKSASAESKATVSPTLVKSEEIELPAGKVCVESDLGGAPFLMWDRNRSIEITSKTHTCVALQPNGYTIEFQRVRERVQVPGSVNVQLMEGKSQTVTGYYIQ